MQTEFGTWERTYTARGLPRYQVELRHRGLNRFQVIRGDDQYVVQQKATALAAQWNDAWSRIETRNKVENHRQNRQEEAEARTTEAQTAQAQLATLLAATLSVDDSIDWDALKDRTPFPKLRPQKAQPPARPSMAELTPEPHPEDNCFDPQLTFLDRFLKKRAARKIAEATALFEQAHADWLQRRQAAKQEYAAALTQYEVRIAANEKRFQQELQRWEQARAEYLEEQVKQHQHVDAKKERYLAQDFDAIIDLCDMVLSNSVYPDSLPRTWALDYLQEARILVVDYQLPAPSDIPSLVSVKYVKARDAFDEKHLSEGEKNRLYDSILYQVTLRTIHELFEADTAQALTSVAFNGFVDSIDPATGHETRACVLTVQAARDEFAAINLASVDPKDCFRRLKGVGSSRLHSLTPVAPLIQMERDDPRFVAGHAVADTLSEGSNLAAMDWEEFEHLIRELFEWEFQKNGAEVRVTRASRDGGVDAVILDPDPIRGGKLVIQAKRYTNTVGVSAVRDLFGAVMAEGANKGILVTTAQYGPDAYEFAKGKPLTLLSGSNLLHLLQQHGVKARIDIVEARKILGHDT